MRIVSFGPVGGEQPGVLVDDDHILPLAPLLARHGIRTTDTNELIALWGHLGPLVEAGLRAPTGVVRLTDVRIGSPVPRPGKILAIGLNYPAHAAGIIADPAPDSVPVLFLKPPSSVSGPNDPIIKPFETSALDYEVELAVVIGTPGRRISRANALDHVMGYAIANDVTARDVFFGAGLDRPMELQISRGKGYQTFCPIGPWLVTADSVPAMPLLLELSVNGEQRQSGSTADMIVDVAGLIESVSMTMELMPGDIILTGTPPGGGFGFTPPRYLDAGDRIIATITGLGAMNLTVTDEVDEILR
jgi:2,4-diketo-3-deoxy-L-fuconate hydrolase